MLQLGKENFAIIDCVVANNAAAIARSTRTANKKARQVAADVAAKALVKAKKLALYEEVIRQVTVGFFNVAQLTQTSGVSTLLSSLKTVKQDLSLFGMSDDRFSANVFLQTDRISLEILTPYCSGGPHEKVESLSRLCRPDRKTVPEILTICLDEYFRPGWFDSGRDFDVQDAASTRDSVAIGTLEKFLALDLQAVKKQTPVWMTEMKTARQESFGWGLSMARKWRVAWTCLVSFFLRLC